MENELILNDKNINPIFEEIKGLINTSRNRVYTAVNTEMLNLYWNIGKIIMEIQQGNERANYGDAVLEKLSQKLTGEFGKGFSARNLRTMRKVLCNVSNVEDSVCQIKLVTLLGTNSNRRKKEKFWT